MEPRARAELFAETAARMGVADAIQILYGLRSLTASLRRDSGQL
jgi:hypothetical protein